MFRKSHTLSLFLAGAATAAMVVWAPAADAQSRGMSRSALGKSQPRVSTRSASSRMNARPSFSTSRSPIASRSNARPSGSSLSRLGDARSNSTRGASPGNYRGNGAGLGNLGNLLNNARGQNNGYRGGGLGNGRYPIAEALFGEYNRRNNYHNPYEDIADAHRDAAIANAVVSVAGIVSNAVVQSRQMRYQQQQPVYQTAAPGPRGHVERQQVLVREGHHEEYTVQVPEHTLAATGERVLAHTERRQRWVEPVYESREIWVTEP